MPLLPLLIENLLWMGWNAMLAFLPLLLAMILFRRKIKMRLLWAFGFILFVLFLPNAPYVLTDVIHLPRDWQMVNTPSHLLLVTWQYILFILVGLLMFCESYSMFETFITKKAHLHKKVWVRVISFLTISIGVYLGRYPRFNSWDVFVRPGEILSQMNILFTTRAYIFITFFTLSIFVIYTAYDWLKYKIPKPVVLKHKSLRRR